MKFITVIIAGGSGMRLWPESRKSSPKQFIKIGSKTLLHQTIERAAILNSDEIVIATNQDYLFLTKDEIKKTKNIACTIIVEPEKKDTAPAIALSTQYVIEKYGEDCFLLVLPADHLITDNNHFLECINIAKDNSDMKNITTFGIRPLSPHTGYGYIEVEEDDLNINQVKSFHEKPDFDTAVKYIKTGLYFWNSGIFFFSIKFIKESYIKYAEDMWKKCELAFMSSEHKSDKNITFDKESFSEIPSGSFDKTIMENCLNINVVTSSFSWNDVGSWSSFADCHDSDENQNVAIGSNSENVLNFDTTNTLVKTFNTVEKLIVTNSIDNLVIIDTPDALLISDKNKSEYIKEIFLYLEGINRSMFFKEIIDLPFTVQRPWGTYATLKIEEGYQVKRITVKPGESLSLQYHHHRSEHWVVVKGEALVQIGEEELITHEKEYRYIPLGEKHRLTNTTKNQLVLIEVQVGDYLGEDDIVRLDDIYGRC